MTNGANQLFTLLSVLIQDKKIDYDELIVQAKQANALLRLPDSDVASAIAEYQRVNGISFPDSSALIERGKKDDDWFDKFVRANPKPVAFGRYITYLRTQEHIGEESLKTITNDIYRTLRCFANPNSAERTYSKGLVVGDVQSGKTSNYLGLINLAIDAGYRDIVLLTGTTELLRNQTQDRVDKGLVGADSNTFLSAGCAIVYEGVGAITKDYYAITFTNKQFDFTPSKTANFNFVPSDFYTKPRIYVIKKNKTVLDQLYTYITNDKKSSSSAVLIIDDECDNASLNTRDPSERTAINEGICRLFDAFKICTYVGYTATPFANIFVMPDDEGPKKLNLYPEDFIILLDTPSDYIGATKMFSGYDEITKKGSGSEFIAGLNEGESNFLPTNHKRDYPFSSLPESLKIAIRCFLLGNVVRTLRGDGTSHRSMLVNISRFNALQEQIADRISEYVHLLQIVISQSFKMPFDFFIRDPEMKALYDVWNDDSLFGRVSKNGLPANKQYAFSQIQDGLNDEISKFEIAIVNLLHADERYNYDLRKERGARAIIVGGFTLSRGLTLYGLMVSYYNRHATAYDVLLQMGRWFGYRPRYEDLVKIFMTQESLDCYCVARDATEELKDRFRWMAAQNKSPKEFGLAVKESPESLNTTLLVTARNKMKTGEDKIMKIIELSGEVVDTSKIENDRNNAEHNQKATEAFLKKIHEFGINYSHPEASPDRVYLSGVPKKLIIDLLKNIQVSYANNTFDTMSLAQFLGKEGDSNVCLELWDVVVATGDEKDDQELVILDGIEYHPVRRSFTFNEGESFLRINSGHNHIVDPSLFRIGLKKEEVEEAKRIALAGVKEGTRKSSSVTSRDYLSIAGRRPLLIIYPLVLKTESTLKGADPVAAKQESDCKTRIKDSFKGQCLFGFAMGFPGQSGSIKAIYRINLQMKKQLEQLTDDSDEDEDLYDSEEQK